VLGLVRVVELQIAAAWSSKDWPTKYVSAYATMDPHEDCAESWAHYLHMVETARSFGLALRSNVAKGDQMVEFATKKLHFHDFDKLSRAWAPLTIALNSLNRSMGLPDLYAFVLSAEAIDKLRFVHDTIEATQAAAQRQDH
jgi:hypothetical protein